MRDSDYKRMRQHCLYAVVTAAYGLGLGTWNAEPQNASRGLLVVVYQATAIAALVRCALSSVSDATRNCPQPGRRGDADSVAECW